MASILFLAGKADVVAGDKHLARDVQLVEWGPQGAACVAVQALVPGQPERGTVALVLGSSVQVSGETKVGEKEKQTRVGASTLTRRPHALCFHVGLRLVGVLL